MSTSWAGAGVALLLAVFAAAVPRAHGTSYSPLTVDECTAAGALAPGAAVFLFHGGSEDARRSIRAGDVLTVYRPGTSGRRETAGVVRIVSAAGELCFRGEVVAGELRPHDVAPAGRGALLVLPTDAPCLPEPLQ